MDEENSASGFSPRYQFLVDYCAAHELRFRSDPESKSLALSVRGETAIYELLMFLSNDDDVLQIYVVVPVAAGDERLRPLQSEFVVRANHHLVIGNFDLNMDDGRLCFHVGHVLGEAGLDENLLGQLLRTALATADRYFPALMRVMFGGHTPADAIFLSELDFQDSSKESKPKNEAAPLKEPKPAAKKKPRRPRKNLRKKSAEDLPGLFDHGDTPAADKKPPEEE